MKIPTQYGEVASIYNEKHPAKRIEPIIDAVSKAKRQREKHNTALPMLFWDCIHQLMITSEDNLQTSAPELSVFI